METNKEASSLFIIKWAWKYIKPYSGWMLLSIIGSFILSGCNILQVYLIKQLIDNSLGKQGQAIPGTLVLLGGMMAAGIIGQICTGYASGRFGTYLSRDLRAEIIKHIEKLPVSSVEKTHSGDMVSRLTNDASAVSGFMSGFSQFIQIPLMIISSFIYLSLLNWKLLLISFITTPVMLFISIRINRPLRDISRKSYEQLGITNSILQDTVGGIGILKAFNLEKPLYSKYCAALGKSLSYRYRIDMKLALLTPVKVFMYNLPFIICIIAGGYMAAAGSLQPGSLVAFIQLLGMLVYPSTELPFMSADIRNTAGAAERLIEILDEPVERQEGIKYEKDENQAAIEFVNVGFSYNESKEVLNDVSFAIPSGKKVALVGPSGCGKTTIFNLICGFYGNYKGAIKVYGHDMAEWNLDSMRKNMSLVSQDPYLYPDSIYENIRYGNLGANKEEIEKASKIANADSFITKMPEGYNTLIGERGMKLSGGQRQRVSLARAVLKKSDILLLDEPTSALDVHSETIVQDAVDRMMDGKTVVVVAHRLSSIKNVDYIFVLDQGKIVDQGTHDQLLSRDGVYKQLFMRQASGIDEDYLDKTLEEGA